MAETRVKTPQIDPGGVADGAYGLVVAAGKITGLGAVSSSAGGREITGFVSGTLTTLIGTTRFYNDTGRTLTIASVRASVGTAPTGSGITIDANKDGTTVFTTQTNRPTIAAGALTAVSTTIESASFPSGSYLTIDIDAVGSTTAGSNLTVQIEVTG